MRTIGGAGVALLLITWGFYEWTWRGKSAVFEKTYVAEFHVDPPLTIRRPDGALTGLAPEILKKAAARRGIKLRLVEAGKDQSADLWPDSFEGPESNSGQAATAPWYGLRLSLVSRADQYATELADLARRKVAVADGGIWRAIPKALRPAGVRLRELSSRREALVSLCNGSVDAVIVEQQFLEQVLLERPDECSKAKLKTAAIPGAERAIRILATSAALPAAEILRSEIQDMMTDGTFARVGAPYTSSSSFELRLAQNEWLGSQGVFFGLCIAGLAGALIFVALRRRQETASPIPAAGPPAGLLSLNELSSFEDRAAPTPEEAVVADPPRRREPEPQVVAAAPSPERKEPAPAPRFVALGCDLQRTLQQAVDLANLHAATQGTQVVLDVERSLPGRVDCIAEELKSEVADAISRVTERSHGHGVRIQARRGSGIAAVEVEVGIDASNQPMQELRQVLPSTVGDSAPPGVEIRLLLPDFVEVPEPEPPPSQVRVLLVDDNPLHRGSARRLLMELGCFIEVAPGGQAALEILGHRKFDLILVDYLMPEMDGPETVRRYRRMENGSHTPVVMLLTGASWEQQRELAAAGAEAYLEKPLTRESLGRVVEAWATRPQS